MARDRPAPPRAPRRRRAPEEAREELLVAADRLLAARGPEDVGLADVAREVGVTHGLVTHYFGTYAGLVREVFVRRNRLAAATILEQIDAARESGDVLALQRFAVAYVTDPHRVRLFLWLRLHDADRPRGAGEGGGLLRALVDVLAHELPALAGAGAPVPERATIELLVLLTLSAGHGWAIGKETWLRGLGLTPGPEIDATFQQLLLDALALVARARAPG
ncbi:TetR/AcrR family transcriptional regulator [Nannocystis pusilla]|uniref:TetR/AcrR family transcriptional regulator n=1 Tax=Nannocystis pusilla TaxID=889268 RepID=UPI003BF12B0F